MLDEARIKGSPAERAEAMGLADLTLRRLGQIDTLLAELVPRAPTSPVNHVLRLMAAELGFAGTAPHAAVDLGVRAVKSLRAGKMSGLVNAVGRRMAREAVAAFDRQSAVDLALTDWMREALQADWGMDEARAIAAAHLLPAPHDLTMKAPDSASGLNGSRLPNGSLRLSGRPQISAQPGFAEGDWWAQDAAASLPARFVPEPRDKRVLDLCAAPGGKTMQLAALGAKVTALDISEPRNRRLRDNLARTGLTADVVTGDALSWQPQEEFDAILLDAPCSATGTIRRHPDLPHRFQPKTLDTLLSLQARLIDRARAWLAPGGTLIYCTCSVLKAEGEAQGDGALARHSDLRQIPLSLPGLEELFQDGRLRTLPSQWPELGHLDGFFAVRLDKQP